MEYLDKTGLAYFWGKVKEKLNKKADNDKYMIDNILSNIKYESNALEKDFNSALKKYKDDKNKLINYLLRKGYSYDEINTKLKNLV